MNQPKRRHGCLTTWLVLIVAANSLVGLLYLFARDPIQRSLPSAAWAIPVLTLVSAANVVFAIALFQWKMWGFVGLVATSGVAFVINLSVGLNIAGALLGFLGPVVLYALLQIGGEKKSWTQLE
jgi:hypothetical protein